MDYVKLAERLIKAVVKDVDAVSVKEFPSDDENKVEIQAVVSEDDMKRVIGKSGRTINSIRTILKASSSLHDHKYINLNVEGF
ncbi:MAG: KH domain-containing protein [Bacilli bacterium]|nr:KH domain-containing protein [Bacilli bacterium]